MNRVSQRQLLAIIGLLIGTGAAWAVTGLDQRSGVFAAVVLVLALVALVWAGGGDAGSTEAFESLSSAVRRMVDGKRPEPPRDASPALSRVYDELQDAHQALQEAEGPLNRAELEEAAQNLTGAV